KSAGGAEEMLASNRRTARPTFYEVLELATRGGAEVLGLGGEIGSLEPGKKADIITVDLMNPFITPTRDPLTSIVLYGNSSDIDNVIVDGRILKLGGKPTSLDLEQALLKAQKRVDEIIDRFFDDYPEQRKSWEEKVFHRK
ncbi:amidohydrolase family protein, partial [Candidatus Bathyarchaeota archaeon]|nr:amidohydrolase family protein [Candidatus Bathyarchaeota archaeon]